MASQRKRCRSWARAARTEPKLGERRPPPPILLLRRFRLQKINQGGEGGNREEARLGGGVWEASGEPSPPLVEVVVCDLEGQVAKNKSLEKFCPGPWGAWMGKFYFQISLWFFSCKRK